MEEELSENELEERMYAMLHHVDETQPNGSTNPTESIAENVPRSTLKRYWRTSGDQNTNYQKVNSPKEPIINKNNSNYQKVNTLKEPIINKNVVENNASLTKDEKSASPSTSVDLSIFQQPVSQNVKKTVEILENDENNRIVELESSDEDEVIEVALPPKPTITIESSDEEVCAVLAEESPAKKTLSKPPQEKQPGDREVTASPVPSVVSSVSDEFIRGDCIALNISSRHPNNQSFDFSLHGSDLLDQTPSKKKKKKRNKDATSTPISTASTNTSAVNLEECFATPKGKAKNKRQRTKSYRVSEKSIPSADVYDSDSNQSMNENNKTQSPYIVTDKSLPNTDVYESDSNQSENNKETGPKEIPVTKDRNSSSNEIITFETPKTTNKSNIEADYVVVDLTDTDNTIIDENIVMANVSGLTEVEDYSENHTILEGDASKCGSTKIPAILNADLDFDNLKGIAKTCKLRRYSLSTLRAEMEKFYNESWGGEEFNHREIQKNMSRDKSLWLIDPRDRMPSLSRRKVTCNYCNRPGHRDDTCRMKPPICFMCGSAGHFEPRCPKKICVNCGSPNHMYSTMCRNCCNWNYIKCAECGQNGHPASHCPDIWRRYHNTINLDTSLEESRQFKKHFQLFCSGCTRRGHLVHTCRITLPFSGLPINSPYVAVYRPVYSQIQRNQNTVSNLQNKQSFKNKNVNQTNSLNSSNNTALISRNEHLKRQSKSPISNETLIKRRNLGLATECETPQKTKGPIPAIMQRKVTQSQDQLEITIRDLPEPNKNVKNTVTETQDSNRAPDFIPITSENHDKRGQIIQDNEVSDTSEVITSARVYITKEIVDKLKMEDGQAWLEETVKRNNLILENNDIVFFLSINGTVGNQEAFQSELREWIKTKYPSKERLISEEADVDLTLDTDNNSMTHNIPKNRNNVLRKINKALESLKKDIGDPKSMYKELVYLQNRHQQLLNQKAISPKQLCNNKENINGMLRKLNMVLLGQAGLADGSTHLKELYTLQEKLSNFRQKNISASLRQEIGQHFHCIFTAIPRDDYNELLGRYYSKQYPQFKKKKHDKSFKVSPNPNQKTFNAIKNVQKNFIIVKDVSNDNDENDINTRPLPMKRTKNKLVFYHRRLLNSQTNDTALKKTKSELVKKLHLYIALLGNMTQISSRNLKKMRKVQEQAQLFLANF